MNRQRILLISGLAALLGGCGSYMPLQQASTDWDNVWHPDMQPRQQAVPQNQPRVIAQHHYQATFEQRTGAVPVQERRAYIEVPQQKVAVSRVQVPRVLASARPAMPRMGAIQAVSARGSVSTCGIQRAEFGSGLQEQLDSFIRLQVAQAEALSESDIDVATKARLMLELSSSVQRMVQKSKGLEFFRAGLYGLCQAHSIGAMTKATYSTKFEKLMKTASENIRLESSTANLKFALGAEPLSLKVAMPMRK